MGNLLKIVVVAIVALIGFNIFAPDYQKDKLAAVFSATKPERQCFNYYKNTFKQPDTAYFVKVVATMPSDSQAYEQIMKIEAKSKNILGEYNTFYPECALENGEFSERFTNIIQMKALQDELKKLP